MGSLLGLGLRGSVGARLRARVRARVRARARARARVRARVRVRGRLKAQASHRPLAAAIPPKEDFTEQQTLAWLG